MVKSKICKLCGKEFIPKSNAIYCEGPHYRPCPMCGKPVEYHRVSEPIRFCSRECRRTHMNLVKQQHPVKNCLICGKEFVPKQSNQKYCAGPHITNCVVCGKPIEYSCAPTDKPNTCSIQCSNELRRRTVQKHFGVDNVSNAPGIRERLKILYNSEELKQKRVKTNIERYGVDNPSKNADIKAKLTQIMNSEEFLSKREQTCLARYGYTSPSKVESVKRKRLETTLANYGSLKGIRTPSYYVKMMTDPTKVDAYLKFKDDPEQYLKMYYAEPPSITQLCKDLGVSDDPIYTILVNRGCSHLISHRFSKMETEVYDYILSLDPDILVKRNDRIVIKPYEIDIYLPDYKLGIECNPSCTHNSTRSTYADNEVKSPTYHQHKSMLAHKSGIFLFHIFGYEWEKRPDIIKSMIRNLLHKNQNKIYGRNTVVKELSAADCRTFLNANHRQGNTDASVRLGLYDKSNELVSVMTFNHLRNTIGRSKTTNDLDWELSRFCNKCNTTICGAASKLFKYFLTHYEYHKIISFSDVAHTQGSLYQTLGFRQLHMSAPSYVWTNIQDTIVYNRVSCQKHNLPKLFDDPNLDIKHQTERQIMESKGFVRVFDSGVIRWEYNKPEDFR